jgi:hypothetical protein
MTPEDLEHRKRRLRGMIDAELRRRRDAATTYREWQEVDVSADIIDAEWVEVDLSREAKAHIPRTPLQGMARAAAVEFVLIFLGAFILGLAVAWI